jgi:hypothetical protein
VEWSDLLKHCIALTLVGYSSPPDHISGALWHDLSYHNEARAIHDRLQDNSGFDVHQVESSIATPKTRRVDQYLEHTRQSIGNFQRLYAHYKQERWSRWKTYRCEQKALHKLSMRVKGNRRAKREDVVVAYGSATWPTRKGMRSVPVKKFLKYLSRYVTVVLVNEYRTSRECSKCWEERWLKKGKKKRCLKKKKGKKKKGKKKWLKKKKRCLKGKKQCPEKKKRRVGSVDATGQVDSGVVAETREEDEGGGGGEHLDSERAEAIRRR